jgi:hypothetical protein
MNDARQFHLVDGTPEGLKTNDARDIIGALSELRESQDPDKEVTLWIRNKKTEVALETPFRGTPQDLFTVFSAFVLYTFDGIANGQVPSSTVMKMRSAMGL